MTFDEQLPQNTHLTVADPLLQAQILLAKAELHCAELHCLALISEEKEEKEKSQSYLVPPEPVQEVAKKGLELYRQFGGRDELIISEKLADGKPITMAQAEEMLKFFQYKNIDEQQPGWQNNYSPSADWIQWQLMGGFEGLSWVETIKELDETMKSEPLIP